MARGDEPDLQRFMLRLLAATAGLTFGMGLIVIVAGRLIARALGWEN